jgi:DNA-binding CsgD family transcriptional regulator
MLAANGGGELPRQLTMELTTGNDHLRAGVFTSHTVESGEPFVMVALEEERAAPPAEPPINLERFGFSKAEIAVVRELLTGAGTREIAARIFVSPATVRTHLKHIYEKADVHSRVELVVKLRGPAAE